MTFAVPEVWCIVLIGIAAQKARLKLPPRYVIRGRGLGPCRRVPGGRGPRQLQSASLHTTKT